MHRHGILLLAACGAFAVTATASPLRDQLALAEKDADRHAQIELIRRILDTEPTDAALRGQLVSLWLNVGDFDMAEAAVRDWPDAPERIALSVQAEALYKRDEEPVEAIALLEKFHAAHPDDIAITRQLAGYLADQREHARLVALLDQAPGVAADAGLVLARAKARRASGDFPRALDDFATADRLDEETARPARASFDRLRAGLPEIDALNKTLERTPDDAAALTLRACWLHWIDADPAAVRRDATQALELAPASTAAAIVAARASYSYGTARDKLSVDLSKPPPSPEALANLLALDAAVSAQPSAASRLAARARTLNAIGQFLLALKDADAALDLDPAESAARLQRLIALVRLDRQSEAAAEVLAMEKLRTPPAVRATGYEFLANADLQTYRLDSALEFANRALKAKLSADRYKLRATILQRLGRMSEANADLVRAKEAKP